VSARGYLAALLLSAVGCSTPSERILPASDAAPPAPAPPCIHEVCADRPVRLRCHGGGMYYCNGYDIDYEWHCRCDTWGVVPPDGAR
jgi:hypothetical protein